MIRTSYRIQPAESSLRCMSFRLPSFRLSGVRTGPNALAMSRECARSEARVLVGCIAWLGGLVGRQVLPVAEATSFGFPMPVRRGDMFPRRAWATGDRRAYFFRGVRSSMFLRFCRVEGELAGFP